MKTEREELEHDACRIADALYGSTAAERKAANDEWNRKVDELEAKLKAAIARRSQIASDLKQTLS